MGATIKTEGLNIKVLPSEINAVDVIIPGDISSASYWLVGGCIHQNADLTIKNVGINKTRAGIINVLNRMGAKIKMNNKIDYSGEPVCDINISTTNLNATTISGEEIPLLIDEIPIIALAAVFAEGETKISDAEELRYKESDRIALTVEWMRKAGAEIEELKDGMIINGNGRIPGGKFSSHGDHRLAMTLGIASLISEKPIEIENSEVSNVSYPKFWETLERIGN